LLIRLVLGVIRRLILEQWRGYSAQGNAGRQGQSYGDVFELGFHIVILY
jgi:hypothetical protein